MTFFSPPVKGKETIHVQDQKDVLRSSRMMKARELQSCFTWHLANATASLMFIMGGKNIQTILLHLSKLQNNHPILLERKLTICNVALPNLSFR